MLIPSSNNLGNLQEDLEVFNNFMGEEKNDKDQGFTYDQLQKENIELQEEVKVLRGSTNTNDKEQKYAVSVSVPTENIKEDEEKSKLSEENNELKNNIIKLEGESMSSNQHIKELIAENSRLKEEIEKLFVEISLHSEEKNALKNNLEEFNQKIDQIMTQNKELKIENGELNSEVVKYQNLIEKSESEKNEMIYKNDAESQILKENQEMKSQSDKIKILKLNDENNSLMKELEENRLKLQEINIFLMEMKMKTEEYNEEIANLKQINMKNEISIKESENQINQTNLVKNHKNLIYIYINY